MSHCQFFSTSQLHSLQHVGPSLATRSLLSPSPNLLAAGSSLTPEPFTGRPYSHTPVPFRLSPSRWRCHHFGSTPRPTRTLLCPSALGLLHYTGLTRTLLCPSAPYSPGSSRRWRTPAAEMRKACMYNFTSTYSVLASITDFAQHFAYSCPSSQHCHALQPALRRATS